MRKGKLGIILIILNYPTFKTINSVHNLDKVEDKWVEIKASIIL